ncbi:MAG TPA: hypothetical protein VKU37_11590, partial [Verrucomicrobiae bacterium]|nr:hypothetical protein [Verrucomicrobiae bacterium]
VAGNGEAYFSTPWRDLMGVDLDGHPVWRVATDANPSHGHMVASPVIGRDGTIYVANVAYLCAINSTHPLAPLANSSWPMFRANPCHTGRVQSGN